MIARLCECIVGVLFGALGLVAAIELGETMYYALHRWWHRPR